MGTLDHEKLDIYQHALKFVADAQQLADDLPGKRGDLGDQLRRASTSIALNIAEGAGEFAPREKARFYRMARRSAVECAAILDVAVRLGLLQGAHVNAREDLVRIVGGVVRLIQSSERRSAGQTHGQG
ncbi:MAG: hypothetical protein A2138_08495 [Deltaproteobacteria bacterium RBG_16_71_12]|nr:MAG: hypothetical protein A2138_08495 [Deltaproteobacteria bacterium RBG_16_71_12]